MAETILVNDARVMSKGQVTIPKKILAALLFRKEFLYSVARLLNYYPKNR